ncbi:MAG: RNA polymerase sigma-54 factor [Nitrospirae bacterium]|nr:RNA polymerase sigma-54 factor [Nitrospirota bacterium]
MALENRLDLRLTQRLVLTPQLQLAIKLLLMPHLELSDALKQEIAENPFLDDTTIETETASDSLEVVEEAGAESVNGAPDMSFETSANFDVDEYFGERASDGRDLGYFHNKNTVMPDYDIFCAREEGLYDHLLWQLRMSDAGDDLKRAAEVVIGNLDEDGYLRATNDELISTAQGVGIINAVDNISLAVSLVQGFDPSGIGARDLIECLLLQIYALNLRGTIVEKLILNDLNELQKKKRDYLSKKYKTSGEEIEAAIKIIEGLEPRPGGRFSSEDTGYITPDVYLDKTSEGYQISLNNDYVPSLSLNKRLILSQTEKGHLAELIDSRLTLIENEKEIVEYKKLLKRLQGQRFSLVFDAKKDERALLLRLLNEKIESANNGRDKVIEDLKEKLGGVGEVTAEEKGFLKEKFRTANELIESLDLRNRTIYKVTNSILKFQGDFFDGDGNLERISPLNLKDIAADIKMHESTVSRAISNKFLFCSHGNYSFKFFFSGSLPSKNGDVSSSSVKNMIEKMIAGEAPDKPMSDGDIAAKLHEQNIKIARRTVAKYREELNILPWNSRRH